MQTNPLITADMAVNEVIQQFPGTLRIFHAVSIDACCGGTLPLGEAARRHGLTPELLLAKLQSTVGAAS